MCLTKDTGSIGARVLKKRTMIWMSEENSDPCDFNLTTLHVHLDRREKRLLVRPLDACDFSFDACFEVELLVIVTTTILCGQLVAVELFRVLL